MREIGSVLDDAGEVSANRRNGSEISCWSPDEDSGLVSEAKNLS